MDARRDLRNKLIAANSAVGKKLDAAGRSGDTAAMKRLITRRKGIRLMLEPLAPTK
jgi:hypothetical protein